jgi:quercetin dioxygenase-like cupin family protein
VRRRPSDSGAQSGQGAACSNRQVVLDKVRSRPMNHPVVLKPAEHAEWRPDKMGKSTLFESPRLLVGLNAFEPGQSHALHAHTGMDKLYYVVDGEGAFLLDGSELPMRAGDVLVAPDGVPHGVANTSGARLLVMAVLAPSPTTQKKADAHVR